MAKYKRVLLKLSGEALAPANGGILDFDFIAKVAKQIKRCVDAGVQVGVIVGAGNIWRGRQGTGMDQCRADHMGMLATVINSLGLAMAIRSAGVEAEVFTATPMAPVANYYNRDNAVEVLERGGVALIAGGTGNPFFTTDTGKIF